MAVTLLISFPGDTWVVYGDWTPPSILTSHNTTSEEKQEIQVKKYLFLLTSQNGVDAAPFSLWR